MPNAYRDDVCFLIEKIVGGGSFSDLDSQAIVDHVRIAGFFPGELTIHTERRRAEDQWASTVTMDDYLADIHALVASADISIAAGRERGGLLVYFIGGVRSHISAYHLGLEPAELFVVIYSADRDRIITGYQFSTMTNLRMPGDCIWLRRLPPLA